MAWRRERRRKTFMRDLQRHMAAERHSLDRQLVSLKRLWHATRRYFQKTNPPRDVKEQYWCLVAVLI